MTTTLNITVPSGWTRLDLDGNRDKAIEEAVEKAFASADRDSSAIAKHWMRSRLHAAATAPAEAQADVISLMYPSAPVAGVVLPMSAQVMRLHDGVLTGDPARVLAGIAAGDTSATPMTLQTGLILRTHSVRDVAEQWSAEIEDAPLDADAREGMEAAAERLPALRVQYMIPGHEGSAWHIAAFSAMLGDTSAEGQGGLAELYLELCDAFILSAVVREDA
ncbi:hypothetical protein LGT39_10110 [Demequina sp. TTPB684]|uniref:hypothetical protein n=1 Tax=unclassified Demequina TaxID=2620311 RepID=UPI001CF225F6|nr:MULTISPECIES: hypothetical protein [unclassified Demequina]MCB2413196.1 hypothetical protein [Demequina sp. TTPB684]UPU88371.1 hypothetical protein LGT36_000125 [Demequina sp. TMPB413]